MKPLGFGRGGMRGLTMCVAANGKGLNFGSFSYKSVTYKSR